MSHYPEYDETSPESIEAYGRKLIGKTFAEVCAEDDLRNASEISDATVEYQTSHGDKNRKGGLGQLIEERHFHYAANNEARPDFEKAGVELKVTPYKLTQKKDGLQASAKERLILTMINYFNVVNEDFLKSHMWTKSQLILLIYYLYQKELQDRLDYRIDYVSLFTPPKEDVAIIEQDFYTIRDKIIAGKAHELSESDTLYLGAATKASSSKDRTKQPYSDELAKPRAFCYKTSYMTYVLNKYIIKGKKTYEPIIKDSVETSFEKYVVDKINTYAGLSQDALCERFDISRTESGKWPKIVGALIIYRILGIKGNQAEEFVKAGIVLKTIRLENNNTIREHMSFPNFKFKELIQEEWEDSTFGNYLRETRFLFVIYKKNAQGELILKGCQFWNIPYEDLEHNVKNVWETTKHVISDGLHISRDKNGRNKSDLPSPSDDPVCHVRPHGKNAQDTDELPDGRHYPKQCFWLHKKYILSQLEKRFLEN